MEFAGYIARRYLRSRRHSRFLSRGSVTAIVGIAIGVMVDASVVLVENAHKHLERDRGTKSHLEIMVAASKEVGPALFYSLLIITVSFLPVFALEEQSGRMFKPLAYTKTFAMAASSLLAITIIPVLMTFFVLLFSMSSIDERQWQNLIDAFGLGPGLVGVAKRVQGDPLVPLLPLGLRGSRYAGALGHRVLHSH